MLYSDIEKLIQLASAPGEEAQSIDKVASEQLSDEDAVDALVKEIDSELKDKSIEKQASRLATAKLIVALDILKT